MMRIAAHTLMVALLTILTQVGGLAWLIGLPFRRRVAAFMIAYVALSASALFTAPLLGRTPLPCLTGDTLKMQSPFFCALNRQYVTPDLAAVLTDLSQAQDAAFPGTQTRILDANFPFFDGFPLLPHLSHADGRKADIAFYYMDDFGYLPGRSRSPIGYFAFTYGPTDCPAVWPTLRWDLRWVQPVWPVLDPEPQRMTHALRWLSADPRIGKIFIEPHLQTRFGTQHPKIRFQGCRAARHDDHIHIQL